MSNSEAVCVFDIGLHEDRMEKEQSVIWPKQY